MLGLLLSCMALASCAKPAGTGTAGQASASAAEAVASTAQEPAHVLLFVLPDRTAPADLASNLSAWKTSGVLTNVNLVKRFGYEEKDGHDAGFNELAVLEFASESDYEEWQSTQAAKLGEDVIATRVDVLLHRVSSKNDPDTSIFVVGQYESLVPAREYQDYTDAYIEPNMANQMFSGIMTRYTMYLEREAKVSERPRAVLVTEYLNQEEYERKSAVKNAYKQVLLGGTHPEWARINGIKKTLRVDKSETYANPVKL